MAGSAGLAAFLGLVGALVTFTAGRSMLRSSLLGALGRPRTIDGSGRGDPLA